MTAHLQTKHIPSLDGLRALAVSMVIAFHFGFDSVNGAMGVEIFFIISGFLITWLLLEEKKYIERAPFASFYARRVARIFPALYTYILFGMVIALVERHDVPWASVAAASTFSMNYYLPLAGSPETYLAHLWSLGVEEQFYFLWPALVLLLGKDTRKLKILLLSIIGLVWCLRPFLLLVAHVKQSYVYHAFETRMDHLAMGCLIAVMCKDGSLRGIANSIARFRVAPYLCILLLAGSGFTYANDAFKYGVAFSIEPLLISVVLISVLATNQGFLYRLFNLKWVVYIGVLSYSLYLYQQIVLYTARRISEPLLGIALSFLFSYGVTLAFAMGSYYIIERPARTALRRWILRAIGRESKHA